MQLLQLMQIKLTTRTRIYASAFQCQSELICLSAYAHLYVILSLSLSSWAPAKDLMRWAPGSFAGDRDDKWTIQFWISNWFTTKPVTTDATDANVTNSYLDPSLAFWLTRMSSVWNAETYNSEISHGSRKVPITTATDFAGEW